MCQRQGKIAIRRKLFEEIIGLLVMAQCVLSVSWTPFFWRHDFVLSVAFPNLPWNLSGAFRQKPRRNGTARISVFARPAILKA